ncbi:hypothetical protein AN958_04250 [Leucoagaricus sp. SymC.cos]|nr:hypothetical protein AN958_04250 [Leucoagaricus sp. SymC.cos]
MAISYQRLGRQNYYIVGEVSHRASSLQGPQVGPAMINIDSRYGCPVHTCGYSLIWLTWEEIRSESRPMGRSASVVPLCTAPSRGPPITITSLSSCIDTILLLVGRFRLLTNLQFIVLELVMEFDPVDPSFPKSLSQDPPLEDLVKSINGVGIHRHFFEQRLRRSQSEIPPITNKNGMRMDGSSGLRKFWFEFLELE